MVVHDKLSSSIYAWLVNKILKEENNLLRELKAALLNKILSSKNKVKIWAHFQKSTFKN